MLTHSRTFPEVALYPLVLLSFYRLEGSEAKIEITLFLQNMHVCGCMCMYGKDRLKLKNEIDCHLQYMACQNKCCIYVGKLEKYNDLNKHDQKGKGCCFMFNYMLLANSCQILYERSMFHFHFLSHELNPDDVSHPNKGQDILVRVYKLETGMKTCLCAQLNAVKYVICLDNSCNMLFLYSKQPNGASLNQLNEMNPGNYYNICLNIKG